MESNAKTTKHAPHGGKYKTRWWRPVAYKGMTAKSIKTWCELFGNRSN